MVVTVDGELAPVGQFQSGGTTVAAPAPLDQIPIFIRAGATGGGLLPLVATSAVLPNTSGPHDAWLLVLIAVLGLLAVIALGIAVRPSRVRNGHRPPGRALPLVGGRQTVGPHRLRR